jgi:hypothetical protein
MIRAGNQIKQALVPETEKAAPQPKQKTRKKRNFFQRYVFDVLGGDFLANEWARKQTNYLLFVAAIALVYIANSYYTEDIARKIDKINRELKELQFEYISTKSEVMHHGKQSELARKLQPTGLKESVEPVKKIIIPKKEKP